MQRTTFYMMHTIHSQSLDTQIAMVKGNLGLMCLTLLIKPEAQLRPMADKICLYVVGLL